MHGDDLLGDVVKEMREREREHALHQFFKFHSALGDGLKIFLYSEFTVEMSRPYDENFSSTVWSILHLDLIKVCLMMQL